jgi:hypothetical protein
MHNLDEVRLSCSILCEGYRTLSKMMIEECKSPVAMSLSGGDSKDLSSCGGDRASCPLAGRQAHVLVA